MRSNSPAHTARGSHGFTLIELTVVLAVIVTLALILTPAITNFINDARTSRTRNDVQTIASAVTQFYKDTGFFPQWSASNNGGAGLAANKVDLLVSPGNVPASAQQTLWITGKSDTLTNQLLSNTPGYAIRTVTNQFGWNGPYLSSDFGADAWGNRYMVNVGLLDATIGQQTSAGAAKSAVWVISAGSNGTIETTYAQPALTVVTGGDDIPFRIQ
ncbi:MAG: prepilin-type N-terminal cleavage/methylation domain-containing protein [Vicinamibacterales bacterium]